jgi:putative transposase
VRRRARKKLAAVPRVPPPQPVAMNEAWAMDFVHDGTAGGGVFRTLNVVDRFTRECLAIEVARSIKGRARRGSACTLGSDAGQAEEHPRR